jgi:hypothetical protein
LKGFQGRLSDSPAITSQVRKGGLPPLFHFMHMGSQGESRKSFYAVPFCSCANHFDRRLADLPVTNYGQLATSELAKFELNIRLHPIAPRHTFR